MTTSGSSEVKIAKRVLASLTGKEALKRVPDERWDASWAVESVRELCSEFANILGDIDDRFPVAGHLRGMRAACQRFLTQMCGPRESLFGRGFGMPVSLHLGEMRGLLGIHVAELCRKYKIAPADEWDTVLPLADKPQEEPSSCENALISAVVNGDATGAAAVLKQGADVDTMVSSDSTALLCASERNDESLCMVLLQNRANVNATTETGVTPLMMASRNGSRGTVEALLARGALMDATTDEGRTALMDAAVACHDRVVECLVRHGANVNMADRYGRTALMMAANQASKANASTVKTLLHGGADVNEQCNRGRTALIEAADYWGMHSTDNAVRMLIENGADVNAADKNGYTALMEAARKGHKEVVATLLKAGADICKRLEKGNEYRAPTERRGDTALSIAERYEHQEVLDLLMAHGAQQD
jgi:ankyrin repeat protein